MLKASTNIGCFEIGEIPNDGEGDAKGTSKKGSLIDGTGKIDTGGVTASGNSWETALGANFGWIARYM